MNIIEKANTFENLLEFASDVADFPKNLTFRVNNNEKFYFRNMTYSFPKEFMELKKDFVKEISDAIAPIQAKIQLEIDKIKAINL